MGREALLSRKRVYESVSYAGCGVKHSLISLPKSLVNFTRLANVFGLNGL